jgi:hypothetical protein
VGSVMVTAAAHSMHACLLHLGRFGYASRVLSSGRAWVSTAAAQAVTSPAAPPVIRPAPKQLHGFTLVREQFVPEYDSNVLLYRHEKTGKHRPQEHHIMHRSSK